MSFTSDILQWYYHQKRDLPWRSTKDPYKIWLSEIILQQTRVDQGLSYYVKFVENYPSIKELALANEDEVLKLWQGLGYYSRARNLYATAKFIWTEKKGVFPSSYKEILSLRGIGPYTAAAISSISFGLPYAVVDGNVYRLLSRYFGLSTPIDSSRGQKEFQTIAYEVLHKENPGDYNQAIMEFGALQCVPKNPNCSSCPLVASCFAFKNKQISRLPVKEKRIKQTHRYFNYFLISDTNNYIFIKQRNEKDIWQNLYDFPLIESSKLMPLKQLQKTEANNPCLNFPFEVLESSPLFKHQLSHQTLHSRFYKIKGEPKNPQGWKRIKMEDIDQYALPKLIINYLHTFVSLE